VGFKTIGAFHGIIPKAMMKNAAFRARFLSRLGELLRTTLSDENMAANIASIAAILEDEVPRDLERWWQSSGRFKRQLSNLNNYVDGRVAVMVSDAVDYFNMTDEEVALYFDGLT